MERHNKNYTAYLQLFQRFGQKLQDFPMTQKC